MANKFFQDWQRRESPPPSEDEDKWRKFLTWISSLNLAQFFAEKERVDFERGKQRQVEMRPATGQERPAQLPPYQPDIIGKLPSDVYGWLSKIPSYAHPYETGVAKPITAGILERWPEPEPTPETPAYSKEAGLYGLPSAAKLERLRQMFASEVPSLPLYVIPIGPGGKGVEQGAKWAAKRWAAGATEEDIVRGLTNLKIPKAEITKIIERLTGKVEFGMKGADIGVQKDIFGGQKVVRTTPSGAVEEILPTVSRGKGEQLGLGERLGGEIPLEFEQLHNHIARTEGFRRSSPNIVRNYLSRLKEAITKDAPQFNQLVDDAIGHYQSGRISEAVTSSEEALSNLHKVLKQQAEGIFEVAPRIRPATKGEKFIEALAPEKSASYRMIAENDLKAGKSEEEVVKTLSQWMPEDAARTYVEQFKEWGGVGFAERRIAPRIPEVAPKVGEKIGVQVEPRSAELNKRLNELFGKPPVKAPVTPPVEAQAGQVAEGVGGMKPPPKLPPTTIAPTLPEPPARGVIQKVQEILPNVKKLTSEYAEKLSKVRSQRLGAAKGAGEVAGGGEKGLYAELGQLKGKVEKPTFTPTYDQYTQPERDELFNLIDKFEFKDGLGELLSQQGYTRIAVKTAFRDILDGIKPTPQNLKYLEQVFGKEAMKPILKFMSPKWGDYIVELFYNSILSGPKTHVVNFVSNTLNAVMSPFEKGVTALVEVPLAFVQRRPRQVFFGEVAQEIFGVVRGIPEGTRAAFKMLKSGGTIEQLSKWEQTTRAFKGKLGTVIKLPTRFLEAADVFGRGINRMMALRAQAYRAASKEGLKGEKFLARLNELMMNPTEEMLEEASRIAEYRLFRQEPGTVVSKLMKLRDAEVWGIQPLRFIIPFLRTPANLVKFGLERSPLAVFNVPMWKNIIQKSPEAADQIARWVVGSTIAATIGIYAADGKITGAAPKNTLERDAFYRAGKQPYSIKIGDVWIAYQRLEPFNQGIAQVAAVVEAINDGKAKSDIFNKAQQVVSTIMNNLVSQTYMSGIANLIGAAEDPVGEGAYLIQQLTTGLIPYSGTLRTVTQATEPTYRQPSNIPEAVMTEIPGMAEKVKPRTNIFGEVSERTTPWYSPFNISPERQTDLDKELERLGIIIGYPSNTIGVTKLNEQQVYEYRNFVGQTLMRELSSAIESAAYKRLRNDVAKSDYIDKIIRDTRADAREKFAEMVGISTLTQKQQQTPTVTPSMVPEREKVAPSPYTYTPGYLPPTQTTPSAPGAAPKRKLPTLGK